MNKNKKGFTLVELLAVIIILALIMVLVTPAVLSILNNSKKQAFYMYAQSLESKALSKFLSDESKEVNEETKCFLYDIKEDFDMKNTGDYDGWVRVNKVPATEGTNDNDPNAGDRVVKKQITNTSGFKYVRYCITSGSSCTPNKTYTFKEGVTDVTVSKVVPYNYRLCVNYQYVPKGAKELTTVNAGCVDSSVSGTAINNTYDYKVFMSLTNHTYIYSGEFNKDTVSLEQFKNKISNSSNIYTGSINISDCSNNVLYKNEAGKGQACSSALIDNSDFKVTFETDGGIITANNITYTHYEILQCPNCGTGTTLPTPTRNKDVFQGWYYDREFKDKVDVNSTNLLRKDVKKNSANCVVGYNDIKIYAKWQSAATTTASKTCKPLEVKDKFFDIVLNANGGTFGSNSKLTINQCVDCSSYSNLTSPIKNDDKFLGWYLDKEFKNAFTGNTTEGITSTYIRDSANCPIGYKTVNLYAKWETTTTTAADKNCKELDSSLYNYRIMFNANGGNISIDGKTLEKYEIDQCANCEIFTDLPVPTKADDEFLGWYTDKTYTSLIATTDTSGVEKQQKLNTAGCLIGFNDIVLYARWKSSPIETTSTITQIATTTTIDPKDTSLLLKDLNVGGRNINFSQLKFNYELDVPYDTQSVNISAIPEVASTKVEIGDSKNLAVGDNVIVVHLTNETGKVSNYTIVVNRYNERGEKITSSHMNGSYGTADGLPDPSLPESDASVKSIMISGYNFKFVPEQKNYNFTMNKAGKLDVIVTPTNENAVVMVSDTSNLKHGSSVIITTKSENGFYTDRYVINIKELEETSAAKKILYIIAIILGIILLIALIIINLAKNGKLKLKKDEEEKEEENINAESDENGNLTEELNNDSGDETIPSVAANATNTSDTNVQNVETKVVTVNTQNVVDNTSDTNNV